MKNKGKKIYFTVIALVMAVAMLISSSITLAYFGASAKGTTVIKMGNPITVDSSMTVTSVPIQVVPSQRLEIEASATIKSEGSGKGTKSVLRAKIEVETQAKSVNVAVVKDTAIAGTNVDWFQHTDGYYYLMIDESESTLKDLEIPAGGLDCPMIISVVIPNTLSNADSGASYRVSVTFCAVQADIYNETGLATIARTISNVKPVFDTIQGDN